MDKISPKGKFFTIDELWSIANQPNLQTVMSKSFKSTYFGTAALKGIYPERSVCVVFTRNKTNDKDIVLIPSHITPKVDRHSESKSAQNIIGHAGTVARKFFVSETICQGKEDSFESLLAELQVRRTVIKAITVSATEGLDIESLLITAQNQSFFNDNPIEEFAVSAIKNQDTTPEYYFDLTGQSSILTPTNEIRLHGIGTASDISVLIDFAESYDLLPD